jgi:hypothetical protein
VTARVTAATAPAVDEPDWVVALTLPGPVQDEAMRKLHRLMVRAAVHQVRRMRSQLPGVGAEVCEDIAHTAADEALTAVLAKLSALGKEVTRQSSSQDVTSQVADVNSRVESARGSLARLRALYSHATKVGDVITIEGEIAQREADLESLEAQQRTLEAQTSMATVQLYLSVSGTAPAATHHDKRGFLGGLSRGWHSFTSAATSIATGVGAALPFLVLVLLIGAAAWKLWPRRAQTPPAPIAE